MNVVETFAEQLLHLGAAYVMAWGDGCERLHDVFDETLTDPTRTTSAPDDSVIMTTWHESESLDDALYFFLNSSGADEHYESLIGASVAVSIGRNEWCQTIQRALAAPRAFTERCQEQDGAE